MPLRAGLKPAPTGGAFPFLLALDGYPIPRFRGTKSLWNMGRHP